MIESGIFMFVAGGFPTEHENETAQYYMNTMEATGYFAPMLVIVEIICGISFITKRFMPFALIIFMSLSVNMVMFHLFLVPFTGCPAYSIFLMNVVLMVKHLLDYRNLLQAKTVA
ncbi:hypothetical protein [Solibacillus sp. CAU 1738]|uniref:hypothetical protein n=1 Tax=Solibacillus sp. CAU 1738 TaxID=3140363 RepID=UPI00326074A7